MPISTIGSNSLNQTSDLTINGQTVGKGGGNVATNTAHGVSALNSNTTAAQVTAFGYQAAYSQTNPDGNSAFGYQAMYSNATGANSVAIGRRAAYTATDLDNTVAVGAYSLTSNTTGDNNTAIGKDSLYSNTTASNNTAVGYQAGYSNTTGGANTFFGYLAGYSSNAVNGSNVFIGYRAGKDITTGVSNVVLGGFQGNQGGLDIRTASNWTVLSDGDGNVRVAFGSDGGARFAFNNFNNSPSSTNPGFAIETNGTPTAYSPFVNHAQVGTGLTTYYVFINGNGTVGSIKTTGSSTQFNTSSDVRLKKNVVDAPSAIASIQQIGIKSFDWKADDLHQEYGVIAQELDAVAPEAVSYGATEDEMWGVDYSKLVPRMIKSIQELKALVDAQATEIAELKAKVA